MIKVLTILFLSALYAFAAEDAFELGRTALKNKDYNEALRQFSIAIKENPDNIKAYNNRGAAHYDLRNYDKALEYINKAIELDSKFASAYSERSIIQATLGDIETAVKDARKACDLGDCRALQILKKENLIHD